MTQGARRQEQSGTAYRTRRLLETYYEMTLQIQDRFGARDGDDVLMLVLIGIADLRGAPMDADLLAEKLNMSRSSVERRLRAHLRKGTVEKERCGKSVVYLWSSAPPADPWAAPPERSTGSDSEMSREMIRSIMKLVVDVASD
ncbi:helix-turn-helix domain-containing protein [Stappia indica]|uniref:helix-turn-helix domain-containing protein n=1 Tax=Stappia indica TaxID=538381 RepID=UPI001CD244CE|nr:helix-turn-helix domain-containing protein [Stappia indica]MCA1297663.1 helix-turn-helix domain-containing protein [Stappia indica]